MRVDVKRGMVMLPWALLAKDLAHTENQQPEYQEDTHRHDDKSADGKPNVIVADLSERCEPKTHGYELLIKPTRNGPSSLSFDPLGNQRRGFH